MQNNANITIHGRHYEVVNITRADDGTALGADLAARGLKSQAILMRGNRGFVAVEGKAGWSSVSRVRGV